MNQLRKCTIFYYRVLLTTALLTCFRKGLIFFASRLEINRLAQKTDDCKLKWKAVCSRAKTSWEQKLIITWEKNEVPSGWLGFLMRLLNTKQQQQQQQPSFIPLSGVGYMDQAHCLTHLHLIYSPYNRKE